ncbi:MAG: hypothetical protein OSB55_14735 [Verrucomicrobiota bacterium]|nr:hypothetical protein [Verrucomicrobiota bacterium]
MQRIRSPLILRMNIRTFVQFCLYTRKATILGSIVNRLREGGCGQQRGNGE